jgi:hypothetical protein
VKMVQFRYLSAPFLFMYQVHKQYALFMQNTHMLGHQIGEGWLHPMREKAQFRHFRALLFMYEAQTYLCSSKQKYVIPDDIPIVAKILLVNARRTFCESHLCQRYCFICVKNHPALLLCCVSNIYIYILWVFEKYI